MPFWARHRRPALPLGAHTAGSERRSAHWSSGRDARSEPDERPGYGHQPRIQLLSRGSQHQAEAVFDVEAASDSPPADALPRPDLVHSSPASAMHARDLLETPACGGDTTAPCLARMMEAAAVAVGSEGGVTGGRSSWRLSVDLPPSSCGHAAAAHVAGSRTTTAGSHEPTLPTLPQGWRSAVIPDGRPYYYHAATRRTQWKPPAPTAEAAALPPGWRRVQDARGRWYYFHRESGRVSWTPPDPLAP